MHFVGVDLAWGQKQRTGLAVLDDDGHLVHISSVHTDDEIRDALAPYVAGPCVVGIDAPLIVTNATGSRAAEQELNRDFQRFQAGAHPSNTGKPEFANGTRGARLCRLLRLDMDPRSGRERRALEVYPHPATVVLFGLRKTLKYKDKRGRTLDTMKAELLLLMDHLERIVPMNRAWQALRADVEGATRKSELGRAEDQVDAVVCAYVALFAARWPERVTTYGDFERGYIVTPTLHDAHAVIREAVEEYARRQPALVSVAEEYVALCVDFASYEELASNFATAPAEGNAETDQAALQAEAAKLLRDSLPISGSRTDLFLQNSAIAWSASQSLLRTLSPTSDGRVSSHLRRRMILRMPPG